MYETKRETTKKKLTSESTNGNGKRTNQKLSAFLMCSLFYACESLTYASADDL